MNVPADIEPIAEGRLQRSRIDANPEKQLRIAQLQIEVERSRQVSQVKVEQS
jgi:hypothetical protein